MLDQLITIFRDIFDDDYLIITKSTTSSDISGWDSLAHIRLIVAIEKFFEIRFTADEIFELENVGEMVSLITRKVTNV